MSKKSGFIYAVCLLFLLWIGLTSEAVDPSNARTNAPFDAFCTGCHPPSGLDGTIALEGIPDTVVAGQMYSINFSMKATTSGVINGGFQMVSVFESDFTSAGDFRVHSTDVGTATENGREYVEHRGAKNFVDSMISWSFDWQAPTGDNGSEIEFYFGGIFGDGDGSEGDGSKSGNVAVTLLDPSSQFSAIISNKSDVICHGQSNGFASVEAMNGPRPYTYAWSNGRSSATIRNLSAGAYDVTVTDRNGDIATATAVITEPDPLAVFISATDVNCFGENSGSVAVAVSGGIGGYTYLWSNGLNDGILDVPAGNYSVTVTDVNGCMRVDSATVNQPSALEFTINTTSETGSKKRDGSAELEVSGGIQPYSYHWNNGAQTPKVDSLSPGFYNFTITDANDCRIDGATTIEAFDCQLEPVVHHEDVGCHGDSSGSVYISVDSGSAPFLFQWSNGMMGDTLQNLTAGTYQVSIEDASNCLVTRIITIDEPTPLRGSIISRDPECPSDSSGALIAFPLGGHGTYSYMWSNGDTGSMTMDLPIGHYDVLIVDENECSILLEDTLIAIDSTAPLALAAGGTVFLDSSGLVDLSPSTFNTGSVDDCALDSLWLDLTQLDCRHLGDSQVLLFSVADLSANREQKEISVVVKDTIAPTFVTCVEDVFADSGSVIHYEFPQVTDNCGVDSLYLIEGQDSGTVFPVGESVVTFAANDLSGNISYCSFSVHVGDLPTHSSEFAFSRNFSVYPNPFTDQLHLSRMAGHESSLTVKVYSLQGELVYAKQFVELDKNFRLDLASLSTGFYILKLESDHKFAFRKLMKY